MPVAAPAAAAFFLLLFYFEKWEKKNLIPFTGEFKVKILNSK